MTPKSPVHSLRLGWATEVNLTRAGVPERYPFWSPQGWVYLSMAHEDTLSPPGALQSLEDAGPHLEPRNNEASAVPWALRLTVNSTSDRDTLERRLESYSQAVLTSAQLAPRIDRGLFVMTAHQAKGKEFDAVVLADAMGRYWRDDPESRRLFYVAVTRATKSLTIVGPDAGASPLVDLCGARRTVVAPSVVVRRSLRPATHRQIRPFREPARKRSPDRRLPPASSLAPSAKYRSRRSVVTSRAHLDFASRSS